ncbi:MAG: DNA gyrase inhibitor YacG [Robiginitomaculum sp.]|nr:DNA gyrase inhibitor YacG [Robiginitomaculum sp.]PCI31640.1 MAG: DNA gyrase inhibitor YacG [Alphaproteobacteria bacterium]
MTATSPTSLCPICEKKPEAAKYRPFCSARCADVDLGRWLKGNYVIPGEKADVPEQGQDEIE